MLSNQGGSFSQCILLTLFCVGALPRTTYDSCCQCTRLPECQFGRKLAERKQLPDTADVGSQIASHARNRPSACSPPNRPLLERTPIAGFPPNAHPKKTRG